MQNKELLLNPAIWAQLQSMGSRLPHGLLLAGPAGIGKGVVAASLAKGLLCEAQRDGVSACGACPSCRWFEAQSHPDFRRVSPEGEGDVESAGGEQAERKRGAAQIKIDQIRELEEFVFVGSHRGAGRVVVVDPAEAMNAAAANSLLKLLEEPPPSVYFILVSSAWRRLLPTILSRCRILKFARPSHDDSVAWLKAAGHGEATDFLSFAGGSPVQAVAEAGRGETIKALLDSMADPGNDPLVLAGRWESQLKSEDRLTMEDIVATLQKWLFDLALFKVAGSMRFVVQRQDAAARLTGRSGAAALIRCYNDLARIRPLASHPLNPRLFLEEIAERYLRTLATNRP